MDKGRNGIILEVFILGDTRMIMRLKGRSMSCNQMVLSSSFMPRIGIKNSRDLINSGQKIVQYV
jgi:hypothetical protein